MNWGYTSYRDEGFTVSDELSEVLPGLSPKQRGALFRGACWSRSGQFLVRHVWLLAGLAVFGSLIWLGSGYPSGDYFRNSLLMAGVYLAAVGGLSLLISGVSFSMALFRYHGALQDAVRWAAFPRGRRPGRH